MSSQHTAGHTGPVNVTVAATEPAEARVDVLVVPVFKGGIEGPGAQRVLAAIGLGGLPVTPSFRGDIGQHLALSAPDLPVGSILLVGLGRMDATDAARLREAAGVAARAAPRAASIATTLAQVHPGAAAVAAVVEGFLLGAYHDDRHKSEPDRDRGLRDLTVLVASTQLGEARAAAVRAQHHARATCAARDLVNLPPDRKRPAALADELVALAEGCCAATVLDADDLADGGFGGILAVGRGSSASPRLVELRYRPQAPLGHVVLAGKGITFDAGGINLKRGTGMQQMKSDMAGAAAVAAAMSVLSDLEVRLEVTGILPLAENLPGGDAQRPQDVIRIRGGTTVEVLDTDAEGRLVLADALRYGAEMRPDAIVDLATLTGGVVTALGTYAAGVMSNDDDLAEALRIAAGVAGEDLWPLPLWPGLEHLLDSPVADLNNTGEPASGEWVGASAIMGGLFLQRFVGDTPWAHLDIAGPAFLPAELSHGALPAGGTGFGVRTLLTWLERRAA